MNKRRTNGMNWRKRPLHKGFDAFGVVWVLGNLRKVNCAGAVRVVISRLEGAGGGQVVTDLQKIGCR